MMSSRRLLFAVFVTTFCVCLFTPSQAFYFNGYPYPAATFHSGLNRAFGLSDLDDYFDSVFSRPAFDPFHMMKHMQEQQYKMDRKHRELRRLLEEKAAELSAQLDKGSASVLDLNSEPKQDAISEESQAAKTTRGIAEVQETQPDLPKEEKRIPSSDMLSCDSTTAGERDNACAATKSSAQTQVSSVFGFPRVPKIEISSNDEEFSLEAEVPGVRKEDMQVLVNEDEFGHRTLSISGERKQEDSKEDKDKGYSSSRSVYGHFSRSFTLPRDVKAESISAVYENGVLKVKVPRDKSKIVTRQIDIV